MLAALLGDDPVAGVGGPDRVDDQRLGEVVGLGHDVLGGLVVDPLDPLEPLDQQLAGAPGQRDREGELVARRGAASAAGVARSVTGARSRRRGRGPRARARSRAGVNSSVCAGVDRRRLDDWRRSPIRRGPSAIGDAAGRRGRVACPRWSRVSVTASAVAVGVEARRSLGRERARCPTTARRATTARTTIATSDRRCAAMPCICVADGCDSSSGLQSSHRPASIGTPSRAAADAGVGRLGRRRGRRARSRRSMVPRAHWGDRGAHGARATSDRPRPPGRRRRGRPGEDDRAVGAGRVPALPRRARLGDPWAVGDASRRSATRPGSRRCTSWSSRRRPAASSASR